MSDVELDDFGQARHAGHRIECKSVTGMNLEAGSIGKRRSARQAIEFVGDSHCIIRKCFFAIGARVQFHNVSTCPSRRCSLSGASALP